MAKTGISGILNFMNLHDSEYDDDYDDYEDDGYEDDGYEDDRYPVDDEPEDDYDDEDYAPRKSKSGGLFGKKKDKPAKDKKPKKSVFSRKKYDEPEDDGLDAYLDDDDYDEPVKKSPVKSSFKSGKSSTSHTKGGGKIVPLRNLKDSGVSVTRPYDFNNCCREVSDILLSHRVAVLNIIDIKDLPDSQRILDFAFGTCYAIDGKARQISENIYMFAPDDIDISGDFLEADIPLDDDELGRD